MLNNKGQAFTEAIFILPIMVVIVFFVIWSARVLLTWQQLISATRYGTDMIANTSLSSQDIKKDIENYLTHRLVEGRRLKVDKITSIDVDIKDYVQPSVDNISDITNFLNNIGSFAKGLVVPSAQLSSVSITYEYELPKFLNIVGMDKFNIKTKLSVLAGSGCLNKLHNRQKD